MCHSLTQATLLSYLTLILKATDAHTLANRARANNLCVLWPIKLIAIYHLIILNILELLTYFITMLVVMVFHWVAEDLAFSHEDILQ